MKFKDIIFLDQDLSLFTETKEPTPVTISLLTSLLNDPRFQQDINELRKEYNIKKPYSYQILNNSNNKHIDFFEFMLGSIKQTFIHYNLPDVYNFRLFVLIVCNAFINIVDDEKKDMLYLSNPGEISKFIHDLEENEEDSSAIMLGSYCTKEDLIQWINNNWNFIENEMKKSFLPKYPRLGKSYKNIKLAQQVFELHRDGKNYNEISDILMKFNPRNEKVCDTAWLKTLVSRHVKRCNKFIRNYPSLED